MSPAEKLVRIGEVLAGRELIGFNLNPRPNVLMLSFAGQKDLFIRVSDDGELVVDLEQETLN